MALDVKTARLLAWMKNQPDKFITPTAVLAAVKADPEVWDNRAAAIWALTRLQELGKIEFRTREVRGQTEHGWVYPAPREAVEPLKAGEVQNA